VVQASAILSISLGVRDIAVSLLPLLCGWLVVIVVESS